MAAVSMRVAVALGTHVAGTVDVDGHFVRNDFTVRVRDHPSAGMTGPVRCGKENTRALRLTDPLYRQFQAQKCVESMDGFY